jgi:hypothetical protein
MAKSEQSDEKLTEAAPTTEVTAEAADLQYNERKDFFLGDMIAKVQEEGINIAIGVVIDPKIQEARPIMFSRGTTYSLAKISCELAKFFKDKLNEELSL